MKGLTAVGIIALILASAGLGRSMSLAAHVTCTFKMCVGNPSCHLEIRNTDWGIILEAVNKAAY